ncbi:hypothetical protein [Actinomadura rugatobispora]|uniref:Secreted protein n=1 Tax=Actinomadura rugatobispora TaxID=1994 RepID=A0ABW0ZSB7_9ACTN|nr:hypothetical protein GCM10010200_101590 [Actinomadura rugatobispora]
MTRCAGLRPTAAITRRALVLLLGACMLLTLGAAVPGGADTGPALPAPATATPLTAGTAGPPPGSPAGAATAFAETCEERERPSEREGVGHSHVRLRCTVSDTRILKTPDDLSKPYLDDHRAGAAFHPRDHDGRPRGLRTRTARDTRALLQVFRC